MEENDGGDKTLKVSFTAKHTVLSKGMASALGTHTRTQICVYACECVCTSANIPKIFQYTIEDF